MQLLAHRPPDIDPDVAPGTARLDQRNHAPSCFLPSPTAVGEGLGVRAITTVPADRARPANHLQQN
jgi:hypothetical protein